MGTGVGIILRTALLSLATTGTPPLAGRVARKKNVSNILECENWDRCRYNLRTALLSLVTKGTMETPPCRKSC